MLTSFPRTICLSCERAQEVLSRHIKMPAVLQRRSATAILQTIESSSRLLFPIVLPFAQTCVRRSPSSPLQMVRKKRFGGGALQRTSFARPLRKFPPLCGPGSARLALQVDRHCKAAVLNRDVACLGCERSLTAINLADERDRPAAHFIVHAAHVLAQQSY